MQRPSNVSLTETAVGVLCALDDEGFDVDVVGGQLSIRPAHRLTDTHRATIRRHRDDLIVLVQSCDPGVASRRALFLRQWLLDHTTTFLICPDLGWKRGQCFSCGDALSEPRYGRCWRCRVAWHLAVGMFDHIINGQPHQNDSGEDRVA